MSDKTQALHDLVNSSVSRREFARRTISGSLIATGALAAGGAAEVFAQSITDESILNFALNLEYLEAEFYTVATTGQRIADIGIDDFKVAVGDDVAGGVDAFLAFQRRPNEGVRFGIERRLDVELAKAFAVALHEDHRVAVPF